MHPRFTVRSCAPSVPLPESERGPIRARASRGRCFYGKAQWRDHVVYGKLKPEDSALFFREKKRKRPNDRHYDRFWLIILTFRFRTGRCSVKPKQKTVHYALHLIPITLYCESVAAVIVNSEGLVLVVKLLWVKRLHNWKHSDVNDIQLLVITSLWFIWFGNSSLKWTSLQIERDTRTDCDPIVAFLLCCLLFL